MVLGQGCGEVLGQWAEFTSECRLWGGAGEKQSSMNRGGGPFFYGEALQLFDQERAGKKGAKLCQR